MPDKRPYRTKVILTQNLLPTHAEPGSVFVCKDTGHAWIATAPLGHLLNLHDLFVGNADGIVRASGPQGVAGSDGKDAAPCFCQPALDEAKNLRGDLILIRAEFTLLKATVQALVEMNTTASSYIAFLQQRTATRTKV